MLFVISLTVVIIHLIMDACEKEIPAEYHRNGRLKAEDSDKVRKGEMTQRQFMKNLENGKYR